MRKPAKPSFSSSRQTLLLALGLLILACACSTTRLTPPQEWTMVKFAE